jgi:RNA polymerase sigma-70 factor (ECF subfamily)
MFIKDYILVQRIKNGDTEAWETLVDQYYDTIFSYCFRHCYGNRPVAEDLTQDVFLKLVENIHNFRFTGKFYNYLFTIAVNTCRNHFTKKRLVEHSIETQAIPAVPPQATINLVNQENATRIQKALNQLNDGQREAIILKFYYNFKVKEIANITSVSVPTAQSRIQQGLKKLKKMLDKEAFEDVQKH